MSIVISPSYYYDLLPGLDSIRLLRLLPSKDDNAVIECLLFDISLQESGKRAHPYEALSYAWGESIETPPTIRLGKHDIPVNPNLHKALLYLRHRYIERIIWADALCINQQNIEEKEQQIRLMEKIYGQANRVVVWLGEAADESDQALEEIRVAGGNISPDSLDKEMTQTAVIALLRRCWFRRIWVSEYTLDNNHQVN
jgi:hypothetical protein